MYAFFLFCGVAMAMIVCADAQAAWFLRPSWSPQLKGKRDNDQYRYIRNNMRTPGLMFRGRAKKDWYTEGLPTFDDTSSPNWR